MPWRGLVASQSFNLLAILLGGLNILSVVSLHCKSGLIARNYPGCADLLLIGAHHGPEWKCRERLLGVVKVEHQSTRSRGLLLRVSPRDRQSLGVKDRQQ